MQQGVKIIGRALFLTLLSSGVCFAEFVGPPSGAAGVVEKEIQKEYSPQDLSPDKDVPVLEVDVPENRFAMPDGAFIQIEHIRVEGNESLSAKEIDAVLIPYLNRKISGKEVKELCTKLQQKYVERGFILTRVYTPIQEIHDNTLTLRVVEGTLGSIEVTGNRHYKTRYILKYFAGLKGNPVNYNDVMRALLLVNENTDLGVGAVFKKGKGFGEVDLSLVVRDKLPVHIYTDYNTWGSNVTTYGRAGTKVSAGNLSTNGDTLSVTGVVGTPPKNLYYINTAYSAPINAKGLYFDISYLYSHFEVHQMTRLQLEGMSRIAGGRVRQALNRSRKLTTDIFISFDYKQLKNEVLGSTGSYDKLRVVSFGGRVDYFDACKGRNLFNASCSIGIPDFLGGSGAVDPHSSRQGAGGRFYILNLDYTRIQALPYSCYLFFSASGQGTFNKLPLPEQIYIGGMGTVRGYPLSVALGDNGYYGTLELRTPIPGVPNTYCSFMKRSWKEIFQLVGFVDHGGVYTNSEVRSEQSPAYLTSAGAGIRFYGPWDLNISFDAGFPLTEQYELSDNILYVKVSLGVL